MNVYYERESGVSRGGASTATGFGSGAHGGSGSLLRRYGWSGTADTLTQLEIKNRGCPKPTATALSFRSLVVLSPNLDLHESKQAAAGIEEPTSCDPNNTTKVRLVRPSASTPKPEIARCWPHVPMSTRWRKTTRILQTKLDEQRSKRLKVGDRVSLVSQLFGANKRFLSATRLAACSRQGPTFSALCVLFGLQNFRLIGSVPTIDL